MYGIVPVLAPAGDQSSAVIRGSGNAEGLDQAVSHPRLPPVEEVEEPGQVERQSVEVVLLDVRLALLLAGEYRLRPDPVRRERILLLDVRGPREELKVRQEVDRLQVVVDIPRRNSSGGKLLL